MPDQVATPVPDDLIYSFGEYELDTRLHELRRGRERVHVEPQVFDVLAHLISRRDRVVPKDELLDKVWGHKYVAPTTLNSRIKAARQAVDDDGTDQQVIRTIHGRGFRFVADVTERNAIAPPTVRRDEQQIRFCTAADGVRIAYATSGAGPPLVKPANWMTHLEYDWESPVWRHWLRALSSDHTLVRYDERGNGLSDRDADDFSFDAWVRDLESVVDAAGLDRFPLFGISQGCAVAITYAVRHPERVTRLVLYGGYVQGMMPRAQTQRERDEVRVVMENIPLGWGHDNPAFRFFFAARFLPEGTPEQMRWFSDLQRITTSPETGARLLSTASTIDVTELLPLVKVPVLVMHGTGDAVAPFSEGRKLASLLPDARFVPLESRNHILLETEPAWTRFVHELRNFLAEESSDARSTDHTVTDSALTREKPAPPLRSSPRSRRRSG